MASGLLLTLAHGPFVAFTVLARYTSVRARGDDSPLVAWAVAARAGLGVGILVTLGLLAYTFLRLRPVRPPLRRPVTRVRHVWGVGSVRRALA